MDNDNFETRNVFSRLGLALFLMLQITMLIQIIASSIIARHWGAGFLFEESRWLIWLLTGLPFYMFGVPVFYLMTRKIPSGPKGEKKEMDLKELMVMLIMCLGAAYIFNIVGSIFNILIGVIKGKDVINPLLETMEGTSLVATVIFAGILAPIFEEYVFRGVFLDKLRVYGDETAIWVTALAFGLFHGNLSQFFYAFILGIIFGYIAINTNQIKYTIILHMMINILGSTIMPALVLSGNKVLESIGGIFVVMVMILSVVIYSRNSSKVSFEPGLIEIDDSQRNKIIYGNLGMILFFILCLYMFATTIIS
ncbi:MAG: CPBP family intramembrane metalloprotease [Epulopiscium sp.]|nr:CPBP family intramembrane metalloprotease [Candidatus Epulonipiscium sp.]